MPLIDASGGSPEENRHGDHEPCKLEAGQLQGVSGVKQKKWRLRLLLYGLLLGLASPIIAAPAPAGAGSMAWTTSGSCPEPAEVTFTADTVTLGIPRSESDAQNMALHAASAKLSPAAAYAITFDYDLYTWDSYNEVGTPNPPYNGGTGYWDSFSVSVTSRPYWELSLTDPLSTTNPVGLGFLWGGISYGDGVVENVSGRETIEVRGNPTGQNYLNVALDTANLPQANHAYGSWGTIRIVRVRPTSPVSVPSGPTVQVGFPFDGWFDRFGFSHPSRHKSAKGDWATDVYASAGTEVRARFLPPPGVSVTLKVQRVKDPTCGTAGKTVFVDVFANGEKLGWVAYAHLDAVPSWVEAGASVAPGALLGKLKQWEKDQPGCWEVSTPQGVHLHLALYSYPAPGSQPYACYRDLDSGTFETAGTWIGTVGDTNANKRKQPCE